VASIVAECTDDVALNGPERKKEQLRSAPHKSAAAQQVKLAEYVQKLRHNKQNTGHATLANIFSSKLHNLESIRRSPPVGWNVRRIQAYFMWAKQVTDGE
jgi:hypothetical protein